MTANKTASVNVRIDKDIKQQAEAILSQIGLPRSVAIDLFYRQIIHHGGIPFSLVLPRSNVPSRDELSEEEFDRLMAAGLKQAMQDDSFDADEVFNELEAGL